MNSAQLRNAKQEDIPALRSLWLKTWPHDAEYSERFFISCFAPEDAYVAEADGIIIGMFFSLKGFRLHDGKQIYSASYLYALAVDTFYRGHGIGRKLTAYATAEDHRKGTDFVFLYPADDSLREWYKDSVNASDCFWQRRINVSSDTEITEGGTLREITPETYSSLKEKLLQGTGYMEIPVAVLELQAEFCRISGGGLYSIDLGGKTGICLGDVDDGHLTLRELLCPDMDPADAAGCVMRSLHCQSATSFTPAPWHTDMGIVEPTCVLIPGGSSALPEVSDYPYWGFLLD